MKFGRHESSIVENMNTIICLRYFATGNKLRRSYPKQWGFVVDFRFITALHYCITYERERGRRWRGRERKKEREEGRGRERGEGGGSGREGERERESGENMQ